MLVLTYAAPACAASSTASDFSASVRYAVSMITVNGDRRSRPPRARISRATRSALPSRSAPTLITQSTSAAPCDTASPASCTFASVVWPPCGNPITVTGRISVPGGARRRPTRSRASPPAHAPSTRAPAAPPRRRPRPCSPGAGSCARSAPRDRRDLPGTTAARASPAAVRGIRPCVAGPIWAHGRHTSDAETAAPGEANSNTQPARPRVHRGTRHGSEAGARTTFPRDRVPVRPAGGTCHRAPGLCPAYRNRGRPGRFPSSP